MGTTLHKKASIPATLKAVSHFTAELETLLASLPLEPRTVVVLAIQELCVNIVEHAYAGKAGTIELEIDLQPSSLSITCTDYAPNAFVPPAEILPPDPLSLPEGGIGLYVIYQVFDHVSYQRLRKGNAWHLQKLIDA